MPATKLIDRRTVLRLSAETGLDWRVVQRAYNGLRVQNASRSLLEMAATKLELPPPPQSNAA